MKATYGIAQLKLYTQVQVNACAGTLKVCKTLKTGMAPWIANTRNTQQIQCMSQAHALGLLHYTCSIQ